MSRVNIIDASAILAYLQEENGQDVVEEVLDAGPALMTTVNCCEVLGKLMEKGMPADEASEVVGDLGITFIDFDMVLAEEAAAIQARTRSIGASLGDRACLSLAMRSAKSRTVPTVYTAEHAWGRVKWPFKIVMIRQARSGG